MKFLTATEIIKQAQKRGFDFGSGNPVNRLRYYIKLGLLPHMERKQADSSKSYTEGFMPDYTVDLLLKIQVTHSQTPFESRVLNPS